MLDERRRELLAAIGIESYCLRVTQAGADAGLAAAESPAARDAPASVRVVIACPREVRRDARLAQPLRQLACALGVDAAAAAWVETDGDPIDAALPDVDCYLMLGAAAARACSAQLSLERQGTATIAVSAEPGELFRDAAGRRALWQSLKPLLHRLRSG
jgi:hypothetical protein